MADRYDPEIIDERVNESALFKTGSMLRGRLVLFDQSFFKYRRFALIDENDGFFVSRLKPDANPVITAELREWRGRAIPLEGKQIHDVVGDLTRQYIDLEVEAEFNGAYNGTQSLDMKRFRVVGVRNEDVNDYHLYMTNLPRGQFRPGEIGLLYRARWEVELLFRELKSRYELTSFRNEEGSHRADSNPCGSADAGGQQSHSPNDLRPGRSACGRCAEGTLGGDLPVGRPAHRSGTGCVLPACHKKIRTPGLVIDER